MKIDKVNNSERVSMIRKINENQLEINRNQHEPTFEISSFKEEVTSQLENLVYSKEILEELKLYSKNIYNETIVEIEDLIMNQIEEIEKFSSIEFPKMVEDIVDKYLGKIDDQLMERISKLLEAGDLKEIPGLIKEEAIESISKNLEDTIERHSEKLFGIIKGNSQGKIGEMIVLKEALYTAMKNIEEKLDGLSEVTIETYKRVLNKIKDYKFLESIKSNPEESELFVREIIKDVILTQLSDRKALSDPSISHLNKETLENLYTRDTNNPYGKVNSFKLKDETIIDIIINKKEFQIESSSERILNFIENIAKGNKEEFNVLMKLVEKTFLEIEKGLGILPQVTKDTYKKTIKKSNIRYPKYSYLIPFLWFDDYRLKRGFGESKKPTTILYLLIILLGLILYYALKSFR